MKGAQAAMAKNPTSIPDTILPTTTDAGERVVENSRSMFDSPRSAAIRTPTYRGTQNTLTACSSM